MSEQEPTSIRSAVVSHTAKKLHELEAHLAAGTARSKADLARLRRAVNQAPGSVPEVWDITLGELPERLVGKGDDPSRAETAVHNALALYALHQQGKSESMNRRGEGLGRAVRRYILTKDVTGGFDNESPILRRFNALSTADSVDELLWHLRSLITQLRGSNILLDFAELAGQLYDFHFSEARDRVRLAWGRQLYTAPKTTEKNPES